MPLITRRERIEKDFLRTSSQNYQVYEMLMNLWKIMGAQFKGLIVIIMWVIWKSRCARLYGANWPNSVNLLQVNHMICQLVASAQLAQSLKHKLHCATAEFDHSQVHDAGTVLHRWFLFGPR